MKIRNKAKNKLIKLIIELFNTCGIKRLFSSNEPNHFLIISTTGLGDTLWGTPAIRALKETYCGCHTSVLTSPSGYELLKENPYIDSLFTFKKGYSNFFLLPRLLKSLRQKRFEVIFIFHTSDRIMFPLAFFAGAERIIGISDRNKRLDFILTKLFDFPLPMHGIEERLALVKEVGADTKEEEIEIFLTEREKKLAKEFLRDKGINEDFLLVGLHPGAQKPYKCWPAQNFIEAGNLLSEKFKCKIIITGDSKERALSAEIASKINGSVSIAGILSIRETAALIENMNLFITNDTGPMHIAFALRTPTVALFSPTNPELYGPYAGRGIFRIIAKPVICNPCIGKKCDVPKCMAQITVLEVFAAIKSIFKEQRIYEDITKL